MKKVFKNILKILIILLIAYIMINNNLKSYSVYYAKNMPNTRKEIEMMVLIDNLDSIYTPELDELEYDFDGDNSILIKNFSEDILYGYFSKSFDVYENNKINKKYVYRDFKEQFYSFNKNFKIYYATNIVTTEKIDIKTIDEEAIKQEIYDFVKPIIDVQPEPKINLQWIFNLLYIDKYR